MRTLYLNQTGHRWKNFYDFETLQPEKVAVLFPKSKVTRIYTIAFWEAIGNFAVPYAKIKGRVEQLTHWERVGEADLWVVNSQENRDIKHGRI